MSTIEDDLVVQGNLRVTGTLSPAATTDITRSSLVQESLRSFNLRIEDWRIHDGVGAPLTTPGSDDLGVVSGTYGTSTPSIQTGDLKNAGATTRYARRTVQLPMNYVAGETVTVRIRAGMVTTVASSSATVDVECYLSDDETLVDGSDLCATAAATINSLTFADKDFTITPTGLAPGDILDIRIAIAVNDSGTGTAVIGCIGRIELLCDTKG